MERAVPSVRPRLRRTLGLALLAGVGACRTPARRATVPDPESGSVPAGPRVRGTLVTRYRYRTTANAHDNDLYTTLSMDVGRRDHDVVTGRVVARAEFDLDDSGSGADPFFDVDDTRDADLATRLVQGYADVHALEGLDVFRVGRQPLEETPEALTFDGLRVEGREQGSRNVRAGAYAGVPTHFFESSRRGDSLVGGFVEARPWRGGRARMDWMHFEDERILGDRRDDLVELSGWHSNGRLRLDGHYSLLEGESRDVRAKAGWFDVGEDLLIRVDYYRLLETQGSLVTALDPFTEAVLEYEPFQRIGLSASRGLGDRARVELETELRRLVHSGDEGPFNREYERYRVRLERDDLFGHPWRTGAGLERWNGDPSSTTTWSVDVSREWDELWSVSASSTYALWDLDLVTLDERRDVRVWALDVRRELSENLRLELLYEYEDDELDHDHVLRGGLRWRF